MHGAKQKHTIAVVVHRPPKPISETSVELSAGPTAKPTGKTTTNEFVLKNKVP